jgi:PAS domain S-box-containing protein
MLASLPATVWMTDEQLVVTGVWGALVRELQIAPEHLIGKHLSQLVDDGRGDHPFIQSHRTALGGHETSIRIEWGGNLYYARIAPLRDDTGAVTGSVGSYQQIGWLPDSDGTLRESDIRLRRVVDSNMIGIAFGNDQGQITDANEAFLELAGYSREDLVADGISWPSLTPIDSHQRQVAALAEIAEHGHCQPFEIQLIRQDGEQVPVLVGGARLSATKREGVAFVLDISERRRRLNRLEAELACADALMDASSLDQVAPALVDALRERLRWRGIALWTVGDDGRLVLSVVDGIDAASRPPLDRLAARTRRAEQARWSEAGLTFAAPLRASTDCLGVLVLVGRANGIWDQNLMETSGRIADRLGRFLTRQRRLRGTSSLSGA